ncbi:MAG: hypothetical protein S4CHLAM45_10540 [Chlamydiales bacterium]|nr:hypothetical protein [Chlamydiales bacterium]MCH9619548.1 hypothetical protein [Chlamydiales bacterium]MCH9623154.1 hypothetical protein [Chlamydiales bacterium]
MDHCVALFGEAEKGEYNAAYYCQTLDQLSHFLGEPPHDDAKGLRLAIQSILYQYHIVYFRVQEEGFSTQDYLRGLSILEEKELFPNLHALCLPGVGDRKIIEATDPICAIYNSLLVMNEKDLYDYLTN